MKIILIQVLLPLATYFIGVIIGVKMGMRYMQKDYEEYIDKLFYLEDLADPEDLQHVGYSEAECGYDK